MLEISDFINLENIPKGSSDKVIVRLLLQYGASLVPEGLFCPYTSGLSRLSSCASANIVMNVDATSREHKTVSVTFPFDIGM